MQQDALLIAISFNVFSQEQLLPYGIELNLACRQNRRV
jgi:hypothetical protein